MEQIEGYPTTGYTYGYFAHISPSWLRLAAHNLSVPFPTRRPLRYLELGYGNGVSLNIHAAAHPGEYWGTDVNPLHAEFARDLAAASGAQVKVLDLSFAKLLEHDELPEFDLITAHGVCSWISELDRAAIVDLVRRKLADGGIFCVSYNALPGHAAIAPLQRLMRLHSERAEAADQWSKLSAATSFIEKVAAAAPNGFFARNPGAANRLKMLPSSNPNYLIHEYLGQHWAPFLLIDVATQLATANMRFVGSATFVEHDKAWSAQAAVRDLVNSFEDLPMRETLRDYLVNRLFRHDIFVRGNEVLAPETRRRLLWDQLFLILKPLDEVAFECTESEERTKLFQTILSLLASHPVSPKSAGEIASALASTVDFEDVMRALFFLTDVKIVHPTQASVSDEVRTACHQLNQRIEEECLKGREIPALASPRTGSGFYVSRRHSAFEAAFKAGARTPTELVAGSAQSVLANQPSRDHLSAVTALREAVVYVKSLPIYETLELRPRHSHTECTKKGLGQGGAAR